MIYDKTDHESLSSNVASVANDMGIRVEQRGVGKTVFVLHGGGGPFSVASFVADLSKHYHVIAPTHPGFAGTAWPSHVTGIKDLAQTYLQLIERAGLREVVVVGFSMGGWIAAEMVASAIDAMAGIVLVNATGISVPGQDILDIFAIAPGDLANYSYHAPDRFRINVEALTEQQAAALKANFAALAIYGRAHHMQDPELAMRLAQVKCPAMVVWGESDRVATPEYGRAFAAAFPHSRFELIPECGHLPQIEQPQRLLELVDDFNRHLVGQS